MMVSVLKEKILKSIVDLCAKCGKKVMTPCSPPNVVSGCIVEA